MEVSSIQVNKPIVHTFSRRVYYPIELIFNNNNNNNVTETKFQRYYTDFVQLREKCCSKTESSSSPPPPLPSKQSKNRELRRISFQYLLQWCLLHQTSLFYEFFGIPEPTVVGVKEEVKKQQPAKGSNALKFLIFSMIWFVLWQSMIPKQQSEVLLNKNEGQQQEIASIQESIIPGVIEQEESKYIDHQQAEEAIVVVVVDEKEEESEEEEAKLELTSSSEQIIESPLINVHLEKNDSTTDQPPVVIESTPEQVSCMEKQEDVVQKGNTSINMKEEIGMSSMELTEVEETIREDQFFTERGQEDYEEEEDSLEIRSKKHHQQQPLEEKEKVSFFFTPSHGVVAFIVLYLVTIIYSSFHPVRASKMPNELEIKFLNEGITSEDISIDSEEENAGVVLQTKKSSEIISDISFEDARRIFDELTVSKRDQPSLNRAFALLLKASGETVSEQSPPYGVLSHFWQEVCSIPVKEAKSKFIDIVLSLDQSYSSSITGEGGRRENDGGRDEEEEEEDSSSLESNSSAMMEEDKSKLVVKWWDGLSPKSSIMTMNTPSPVKRVIGGEDGDNNNQSFIITTPSISTELKLDEIDQLLQDDQEEVEEEEAIFFHEKNEFPDVALGTILGFVGTAAFITSISRVRKLF